MPHGCVHRSNARPKYNFNCSRLWQVRGFCFHWNRTYQLREFMCHLPEVPPLDFGNQSRSSKGIWKNFTQWKLSLCKLLKTELNNLREKPMLSCFCFILLFVFTESENVSIISRKYKPKFGQSIRARLCITELIDSWRLTPSQLKRSHVGESS